MYSGNRKESQTEKAWTTTSRQQRFVIGFVCKTFPTWIYTICTPSSLARNQRTPRFGSIDRFIQWARFEVRAVCLVFDEIMEKPSSNCVGITFEILKIRRSPK